MPTALLRRDARRPTLPVSTAAAAPGSGVEPVELRILWYNTYLLGGLTIPLGTAVCAAIGGLPGAALGLVLDGAGVTTLRAGEKQARRQRAVEIGEALAAYGYDLAVLCEVFESADRQRILVGLAPTGRDVHWVEGPPRAGSLTMASSGLLTISLGRPVVGAWHRFTSVGNRLRDSDAWASKGVLRTVLDLGVGELEVYSTHIFNGGGLPVLPRTAPPLTVGERARIQDAQLAELVTFYRRTHRPQCPALLVGDFNIDAADHLPNLERDRYAALIEALAPLGFEDVWAMCNGGRGCTSDLDGGDSLCRREAIAPLDATGRYCDDTEARQTDRTSRIDYIFALRPDAAHAFRLDLGRPRRVPFRRQHETGGMRYLSDHIGLETVLTASPR